MTIVYVPVIMLNQSTSSSSNRFLSYLFAVLSISGCHNATNVDTQFVAEVIESKLDAYRTEFGRPPSVRAAATMTRNLCYANKDQLSAGVICAGWDAREGGLVFAIPQVLCCTVPLVYCAVRCRAVLLLYRTQLV